LPEAAAVVDPPVAEEVFVLELVEALEVVEEPAFDEVEVDFLVVDVVVAAVVVAAPGRHCE
jgi:hypothetical protein